MENSTHFEQITDLEMAAIYGGTTVNSSDHLLTPLIAKVSWALSELSKTAMEYQASLPPGLKK